MTASVQFLVEFRPALKGERYLEPGDGVNTWMVFVGESDPVLEALLAEEEAIARGANPIGLVIDTVRYPVGMHIVTTPDPYRQAAAIRERRSWPAPLPGTHEADLYRDGRIRYWRTYMNLDEFDRGRLWSRENTPKEPQ